MKFRYLSKAMTCLFAFALVAAFDYFTPFEVSSFPVYLLPVMLAFFYFGREGGYLAAIVACGIWYGNDLVTGHIYHVEATRYWNGGTRLVVYGFFVYGLATYARTIDAHRRRLDELQRIIPMCHGCGRVWWADGTWKTPAEALAFVEAKDHLCECPNCHPAVPSPTSLAA